MLHRNRTTKGSSITYGWDCINRMTTYNASNYSYRADGLRVRKKIGYNSNTWVYAHDGQMGFEDACYTLSGTTFTLSTWNDYALGGRGIDMWTNSFPSSSTNFYPIFDPHGNQVSYVSKVSGSSYWQAPQRSFDPWGNLRLGSAGNQPNGRYCANIGHENDDESTMVYMRARHYDQVSGRFISEDPSRQGTNWWVYANNDPVDLADITGRTAGWLGVIMEIYIKFIEMGAKKDPDAKDLLEVICRGAYGYQVGLVTEWAFKTSIKIMQATFEDYNLAMYTGGGADAMAIIEAGGFCVLICFAIDAIDIFAGESIFDLLFGGGDNGTEQKKR